MRKSEGSKALSAGVWYTVCNFLVKGATFLTTPIFTRLMSVSEVGQFSNIVAWVSIFSVIMTFDLYASVTLAKVDYIEDIDNYVSSILALGTLISGSFYILFLCFKDLAVRFFLIDEQTLHIILIYMLVYPALQIFQIKSRIFYKYKLSVLFAILTFLLSTFTSLVFVLIMSDKLRGRILGFYIPLIIFNSVIYVVMFFKSPHIKFNYWKYALSISVPLIWHTLAGNLLSSCDRIIITRVCGPSYNALYSAAYTCASLVAILWSSLNNAWSPWAYDQMSSKQYSNLKCYSKPYAVFFLIVVFGFVLVSPELLFIMGGESYLEAKYVIPPVMVGFVFQFIYSLYVNIEFYEKKQKLIAMGTVLAAVLNIVLNYIFVPKFGYVAAAYTTMIGYIALCILHYVIVRRLRKNDYYDNRFFAFILVMSVVVGLAMNYVYAIPVLRFGLIVASFVGFIIVVAFFRNEICMAVKQHSLNPIITRVSYSKGKKQ